MRTLFATPVDPAFIAAWRDYGERYERVVSGIWLADLWPESRTDVPLPAPTADFQWEVADDEAVEQASGVEKAIEFAEFNADQDHRWDDSQIDFIRQIQEGVAAWERLKLDTGFDLRGIFRRRALVPFVLVPRQVADLEERIRNARSRLPRGASEARLHRLRKLANAILHLNRQKDEGLPAMNEVRLEKEIVSLLFVLRALIEGAK